MKVMKRKAKRSEDGLRLKRRSSKFLLLIWIAVVGMGLAAGAGILLSQSTIEAAGTRREANNMLAGMDRTMYYGVYRGSTSFKCSLNGKRYYAIQSQWTNLAESDTPIYTGTDLYGCTYLWQPVDQEYALGAFLQYPDAEITNKSGVVVGSAMSFCSKEMFNPNNDKGSDNPQKLMYTATYTARSGNQAKSCYAPNDTKDERNFVDFYEGATYMGQLYDVREYVWKAYSNEDTCNARIQLTKIGTGALKNCAVGAVLEFHFYPQGTLRVLDELTYEGGVFKNADGSVAYTWETYRAYLEQKEREIKLVGLDEEGVFKGFIRFHDIDTLNSGCRAGQVKWGCNEGYEPLNGVDYIYTSMNTIEHRLKKRPWGEGEPWYNNKETGCNTDYKSRGACYIWGGTAQNDSADAYSSLWVAFTSSYDSPFRILYHSYAHGSGTSSSTTKIAYIIEDDIDTLPDEVKEEMARFAAEYEKIHGVPLSEDSYFKSEQCEQSAHCDTSHVLRLFEISQYSSYDVYTINDLLSDILKNEDTGEETLWYATEGDIDGGNAILREEQPTFIKNINKTYYTRLNPINPVVVDPTCYSENGSPVTVTP